MNWLLKIVDGPVKGAEIALVEGLRLKVGSGDACDIVLADATLPEVAFELDVTAETVSLIRGEETRTLVPFEITPVGTTSIAIGPAEGEWEPLHEAPAPKAEESAPAEEPAAKPEDASAPENPETPKDAENPAEEDAGKKEEEKKEEEKSSGHGGLWYLSLFLLFVLLVFLLWYFWPWVCERAPWAESARVRVVETCRSGYGWVHDRVIPPPPVVVPGPTLKEIARDAGLRLGERDGRPLLSGNLKLRTERMAVRSLALADDPQVQFDLTDDESLFRSAEELLFVVSEGGLHVAAASNRVVTLSGYSPTAVALEKAVRALNADVKGLEGLVTKDVAVGGTPPPKPGALVFDKKIPEKKAARAKGTVTPPSADYPIAGILTVPYRCVVLRNGMRLAEGGQIGTAVIEQIEADRLVLRDGATKFEWKP